MKKETAIEKSIRVLEENGFHVTDAKEERAINTETGHVIDSQGLNPTGAILIRAVPETPEN